ncbi:MAG: cytochrome c maturation protein CcmE, partial [Acidimicrobiaceae bacterium]|nr:cytochrome c maturation protein CcmE [Acidimicrobiaceae bacterium]
VPSAPPARRARPRLLGTRRRQVVAAVVIVGAIGFLVREGLNNATSYFLYTDQAVAQKASLGTKPFRIEGTVEPGVRRVGQHTDFTITAHKVAVPVVSTGTPTSLFKPGIPVVLDGHWSASGQVYDASLIMVKHTANYVEAHPNRLKSQLPKAGGSR